MLEHITENIFFKIAVFALAAFCIITLFSANSEKQSLILKRDEMLEKIERTKEEILSMENDLSKPYDDEYVIKTAREKLNMRLPEEIVFVTDITD